MASTKTTQDSDAIFLTSGSNSKNFSTKMDRELFNTS